MRLCVACDGNGFLPHNLVQASQLDVGEDGAAQRYGSQCL
jgi:hypothetical protein